MYHSPLLKSNAPTCALTETKRCSVRGPQVVLSSREATTGAWKEIGRTEVMK
jgi:hypothetical protein